MRAVFAGEAVLLHVLPVLEQVQGERHERVPGLADPELLLVDAVRVQHRGDAHQVGNPECGVFGNVGERVPAMRAPVFGERVEQVDLLPLACAPAAGQLEVLLLDVQHDDRSEEHTSELQSLMRISYAVLCWKKKTTRNNNNQ